jgi:hypothetical protein
MQEPLQSVVPPPHRASQRPPTQLAVPFAGGAQTTPQSPQFTGSFATPTQPPSQSAKPSLQSWEHAPARQTAVAFAELGHS